MRDHFSPKKVTIICTKKVQSLKHFDDVEVMIYRRLSDNWVFGQKKIEKHSLFFSKRETFK